MGIRYLSPHHSPEDPGGLIGDALDLGAEFPGPAEDLLLSWTLRLGPGVEAQQAARTLLERYAPKADKPSPGAAGRLVELLRATATQGAPLRGRRRGGWRGRRS